jgi:membrane protease YdiL (CAAX protease family)
MVVLDSQGERERQDGGGARRWALVALVVLVLEQATGALLFIFRKGISWLQAVPAVPLWTCFTHWVVPLAMVRLVEKRGVGSLGLIVRRERRVAYALYGIIGLVLPLFFVGADRGLLVELAEQIVYIGLAEELFFRGYLLTRLCDWLGDRWGILLSSLIFGVGHIVSRVSQHGLAYPGHDLMLGLQTFLGGLLLGWVYLRSGRSIVPVSIIHVSANMYLERIISTVSG